MPLKNAVRMIPGSLVHWSIGPRSIPNVRTGESNRDRIQTPPPDNQNRPGVSAVRVDSVPHGWLKCVVSTAWKGEHRTRGEGYRVLLISRNSKQRIQKEFILAAGEYPRSVPILACSCPRRNTRLSLLSASSGSSGPSHRFCRRHGIYCPHERVGRA